MPAIEIRDTALYYESTGDGTPLLFIHGMCGDANVWRGQVLRLAGQFRCITYDRRGHTRSAMGHEPESVPTHAEDAAALITVLGVRPIVVGSSGGARIAVELARRHPELLAGAVVSEPPIFSLEQSAGDALMAEIGAVVGPAAASEGPRGAVDAFFALVCPGLWSALDEATKDRYRANAHMMLAEFGGPRYHLSVEDLSAVAVPALVITGAESHPALRSIARILACGLPDARFVELHGSGHVTYAERPDEFARAVVAFSTELHPQPLPVNPKVRTSAASIARHAGSGLVARSVATTSDRSCATGAAAWRCTEVSVDEDVRVEWYTGDRAALGELFALAEDSAAELESYLHTGRLLVAVRAAEVVGHLLLVDAGPPGELEIKNMAVRGSLQGRGIGAGLVRAALGAAAAAASTRIVVATAAADTGNLRFNQRQGFRMRCVERDAFTPASGYQPGLQVDGIELRDRAWLDQPVGSAART